MESLFSNGDAVALDDADLAFLAIRDHERWRDLRACLDNQWARYREYADCHFLDQIQRRGQFHSRVWELRLGCALLDTGYKLASSNAGPDFTIEELPLHIEAIAPAPSEPIRNAARDLRKGEFVTMPDEEIILRFTSAFAEKRRKRNLWLGNAVVRGSDPFVIALSDANFGPGVLDPNHPLVLYPLFGVARMTATFGESSEPPIVRYEPGAERIKAATGALVDNFLFRPSTERDSSAPVEVSAVIFSDSNFRSDPDQFDDFVCIHNPNALHPIREGFLPFGREFARRGRSIEIIKDYRQHLTE